MAKRQTRRSISLKGLTYQRLQKWCARQGTSMSGTLENIIAEKMDALGIPEETTLDPRPEPPKPDESSDDIHSNIFTF